MILVIVAIAYGILAIVGGIIGYTKAKSRVSLVSGSVSGGLLVLMGVLLHRGLTWGRWGAIAITTLLVITFIIRLIKTRKVMPAGLMVVLGIPSLIILWFG